MKHCAVSRPEIIQNPEKKILMILYFVLLLITYWTTADNSIRTIIYEGREKQVQDWNPEENHLLHVQRK